MAGLSIHAHVISCVQHNHRLAWCLAVEGLGDMDKGSWGDAISIEQEDHLQYMWLNKKRLLQPLICFGGQDDDDRIWWYFWWNSNRSQLTSRLPEPGTPGPRSGHAAAASAIPHLDGYKGLRGLEFDRHVPSIQKKQCLCTEVSVIVYPSRTPVDGPMAFRPAFPRRKWRLHSSSLWRGRCCGPRSGLQGSRGSTRGPGSNFITMKFHNYLPVNPIKSH